MTAGTRPGEKRHASRRRLDPLALPAATTTVKRYRRTRLLTAFSNVREATPAGTPYRAGLSDATAVTGYTRTIQLFTISYQSQKKNHSSSRHAIIRIIIDPLCRDVGDDVT